jgi:hypothetical protein
MRGHLLVWVLLVVGCKTMGGGHDLGHMSGGGGGGGGGGGHVGEFSAPSHPGLEHTPASNSQSTGQVLDTALDVAATVVEAAAATSEAEALAPSSSAEPPPKPVRPAGDLCLDCSDPGNCGSCPAVPFE